MAVERPVASQENFVRDLSGFTGGGYDRGRSVLNQVCWFVTAKVAWERWWFPSLLRPWVLRRFGASIGRGVLLRHGVRIHLPWKLSVGDNVWIGEDTWIINLEPVIIANDVCISQGVMLCAGSHARRSPTFEYDNGRIVIEQGSWIAARATVLRGVTIHQNAVVGAAAVASVDIPDAGLLLASMETRSSGSLTERG